MGHAACSSRLRGGRAWGRGGRDKQELCVRFCGFSVDLKRFQNKKVKKTLESGTAKVDATGNY